MKKNLFFSTLIAALGFTSCSDDTADFATPTGQEVKVTYSVGLPNQLASRAYGEASQVSKLYYAVYEAGTNNVVMESTIPTAFGGGDLQEAITLNLVTGKSYDIVFWADAASSPYTYDAATQKITVDYSSAVNGDESRDAFFGSVASMKVSGASAQTIELRRPFAQLNIGTSDLDIAIPAPTTAAVTVPVYDQVNLLTGAVSNSDGSATPKEVTFTTATFPTEAFPIEPATYKYMAMNYLLVNNRELVKVSMTTSDANAEAYVYDNVPVQRNYRTNIYGALLTAPTVFNVVVRPQFETPDYENFVEAASATELLNAVTSGQAGVVLTQDITIQSSDMVDDNRNGLLVNGADKDVTIDLNGHTLDLGASSAWAYQGNLEVKNGNVVVSSSQGFKATGSGQVTVEDVTVTAKGSYLSYASAGSSITMNNVNATTSTYGVRSDGGSITLNNVSGTFGERAIDAKNADITMTNCDITVASGYSGITAQGNSTVNVSDGKINVANGYGISTNASDSGARLEGIIENCEINALNPVMVNVPSDLTVKNCKLIGIQSNIVRGGNVTFENCEMIMNFNLASIGLVGQTTYEEVAQNFMNGDWGTGNAVPMAALVLGNRHASSYQYPTNVTFVGNNKIKVAGPRPELYHQVYAYANQGSGLGVTFTYPAATTTFVGGLDPMYASANIIVNGVAINN